MVANGSRAVWSILMFQKYPQKKVIYVMLIFRMPDLGKLLILEAKVQKEMHEVCLYYTDWVVSGG